MTGQIATRVVLAALGAAGGALVWGVIHASEQDWIGAYPALIAVETLVTLFGAFLVLAGPIGMWRAVPRALGLAAVVAGLCLIAVLRYPTSDDFLHGPIPALAVLTVAMLSLPFLIAGTKAGWRDYPSLFLETWSALLRLAAAGAFTGLVWLVVQLSNEVLRIVGIDLIGRLINEYGVVLTLTGAIFGLGMAVVHEFAESLSPYVVLRLVRLFLPVVLAVMVVFLVALPFRGLDGLAGGLSPALLLLTMVAGGIALVSIAVDQTDADATDSPVLRRFAQAMALLLPVVAALALWAIWLRVVEFGWSPDRVFVAAVAGIAVGYGLVYALAVLRGALWMQRIRQGNIGMALVALAVAALWLTPVLNAERISAQSQLARFEAGKTPVAALDLYALRSWGAPGAEVIAALEAKAKEPGQEALAALLAGNGSAAVPDRDALIKGLTTAMPVQPATATGMRDTLLQAAEDYQLQDWQAVCGTEIAPGRPGCLMVVADLMPLLPGEEAMLFLARGTDYVEVSGLYIGTDGQVTSRGVMRPDGSYPGPEENLALMRQYQDAPPPVTAVLLNQLGTDGAGLFVLP